jgi:oxygen-independent coproporphyrinogen-3 oxidase
VTRPPEDPLNEHLLSHDQVVAATPIGLYLHVPFCSRRCGYCAFATSVLPDGAGGEEVAQYLDGVERELRRLGTLLSGRVPPLSSIYLGGGTPTLLDVAELVALLGSIRCHLPVSATAEVTVEANPESLPSHDVGRLAAGGVTRLSIGVQSAAGRVLELLDRTHDPAEVPERVSCALAAGIEHVSVDLIHGTPGETASDWRRSLELALDAGVDHVSCYALAVEPGTKLAARMRSGALTAPDPDVAAERYRTADAVLCGAGFEWYELSNWARGATARSRHNLLCWRNQNWLGVGPAAHSHLSGLRRWNHRDLASWTRALAAGRLGQEGHEVVGAEGRELERVMLGLRLREGLRLASLDPGGVAALVSAGWAQPQNDRLVLTLEGRLRADAAVRRLCVDPGRPVQKSVRSSS